MKGVYDAIVVGSGVAGLTCAAYLCRYGYRPLVCERSNKTGGLVKTFSHQGYAFDAGIRAFENSGIVFPMLKNLGIDMEFARNPVSIGIGERWIRLSSDDGLTAYAAMLTELFPENAEEIPGVFQAIQAVMGYMDVLYGIDNPLFEENMFDRDYVFHTLLPWLVKYQINIRKANRLSLPVREYLRRFTGNASLIDMLCQHFFTDTPTLFALSYFRLYRDYCYPKGGTGVLAVKLTDRIREAGGEVLTQTPVRRVDSGHRQIHTDSKEFTYKKLIWAADQKGLYSCLDKELPSRAQKQRELTLGAKGGESVLSLYLGVNLDNGYFEQRCGAHAFYTPSTAGLSSLSDWRDIAEPEELLEWVGQYLERTTYELSCPALRDASLAPAGKTGVIVSTLFEYGLVQRLAEKGCYASFKDHCSEKIISVLEQTLFSGLRRSIEFSLCSTPLTIEKETGNTRGAITGWAFTNERMPDECRFQHIMEAVRTPMEDILQCGQWTFSPSGLPVSIFTGKLAADTVKRSLKGSKSNDRCP